MSWFNKREKTNNTTNFESSAVAMRDGATALVAEFNLDLPVPVLGETEEAEAYKMITNILIASILKGKE